MIAWAALSSDVPIVLLPLRLEVRFFPARPGPKHELWLRLFPDDIAVDTHEPELTQAEVSARAGLDGVPTELAWAKLAARFGPRRAAYLLQHPEAVLGRARPWTRAARARVLPDGWVACGYRRDGTALKRVLREEWPGSGADVEVGLAPPDPGDPDAAPRLSAWMTDFEAAQQLGLGRRLRLTPESEDGVDLLLVYGVRGQARREGVDLAEDSAAMLAELVDAHHYTDGVAFLPVGAPTNNTPAAPSSFQSADPGHERSFAVEAGAPLCQQDDGSPGDVAAAALGIAADAFAHVEAAGDPRPARLDGLARQLGSALYPATIGYFIDQMLDGLVPPQVDVEERDLWDAVRAFLLDNVRARGPLPALRVGRQPYGLLPVTSVERLAPRFPMPHGDTMLATLRRLRGEWLRSSERVPRISAQAVQPEQDLASILAMTPRSVRLVGRSGLGAAYASYLYRFINTGMDDTWWARHGHRARAALRDMGLGDVPSHRVLRATFAEKYFVIAGAPVRTASGGTEYLSFLQDRDWQKLRAPAPTWQGTPLLWLLLRHAALLVDGFTGARALSAAAAMAPEARLDPEMIDIGATGVETIWQRLLRPWEGDTLGAWLFRSRRDPAFAQRAFTEFWRDVTALAQAQADELEELLPEALDVCAHRLDAWLTGCAAAQLRALRSRRRRGAYLAACGWLENVRPPQATSPDLGFVLAPSLEQAATAAVLRSGYLAHRGGGALAIDLTAERTRMARWLIAGVRAGQPLGGLLGYRLERALVEAGTHLGRYVAVLRAIAPLAGAHAIDGLAVLARGEALYAEPGMPEPSSPDRPAVVAVIERLASWLDAVADLLVAESVHQTVLGRPAAAGAVLDALSRGEAPPAEQAFVQTPARGIGVSHRLVALVPATATAAPGWTRTLRAQAEPRIELYAALLLGDPSRIRVAAQLVDADGRVVSATELRLDQLGVGALDVALAPDELEARFRHRASPAPGTSVRILAARDPSWSPSTLSLGEALPLARAVGELVSRAGALRARDLAAPGAEDVAEEAQVAEVEARVGEATLDALAAALGGADPGALPRALLDAAGMGIAGCVPRPNAAEWPDQAARAALELARRRQLVRPVAGTVAERRAGAEARLRTLFGGGFPVATLFSGPDVFAGSAALLGGELDAPATWLARASWVQAGAGRLERALVLAESGGAPHHDLVVAQQPAAPGQRWAGLARVPYLRGSASIVAHAPAGMGALMAGLVIDGWTEVVPDREMVAGVAFGFDAPRSRAPNVVLVAACPDASETWSAEALEATLCETADLARIRAVDVESLSGLGQHAPALLFAVNLAGDVVSTDFTKLSET